MGRCNSLGLLKPCLSCASQLSGASILWFDVRILSSLLTVGSAGSLSWQLRGWWLPRAGTVLLGSEFTREGSEPPRLWQPCLAIQQEILHVLLGWDLFFIINSLEKKSFSLHNWLLVMSCKFLGLLSNLGKALSSFFQHMSYKVSGHFKCFCAVSPLNMKDAHSTHFWGPSRALDGTCVSEGCWGLTFSISW